MPLLVCKKLVTYAYKPAVLITHNQHRIETNSPERLWKSVRITSRSFHEGTYKKHQDPHCLVGQQEADCELNVILNGNSKTTGELVM